LGLSLPVAEAKHGTKDKNYAKNFFSHAFYYFIVKELVSDFPTLMLIIIAHFRLNVNILSKMLKYFLKI